MGEGHCYRYMVCTIKSSQVVLRIVLGDVSGPLDQKLQLRTEPN